MNTNVADFLGALFGDDFGGAIEVRVLYDDGPGRPPVDRRWYSCVQDLLDDLPELSRIAERANAGIFFGVLPRCEAGVGKAEHTMPGRVLWADIDFKDFPGGEAEGRALLAAFPIPPSIIVRSGCGLHCYWLLRADVDPASIEAVNKQFVEVLKADHAFDRARVLRLPGTYHRKDPANPRLVEIEVFETTRVYGFDEMVAATDTVFRLRENPPPGPEEFERSVAHAPRTGLPENVQALINTAKKVRDPFLGTGKPEKDGKGKLLDRSSSGYDYSFVSQLVRHGVLDPSDLERALAARPDGSAATKGSQYIQRTVRSALERIAREEAGVSDDPAAHMDFKVTKVVIFTSNPPAYAFTIDDVELRLDSGDVGTRSAFAQRFLEALHRLPMLPDPQKHPWSEILNGWLRTAQRVEQPPEASKEGALREAVEHAITQMGDGDAASDLDRAKAIQLAEGRIAFRLNALFAKVREELPDSRRNHVSRVLRELGFVPGSHRIEGQIYRLWSGLPPATQYAREGEVA